MTNLHNLWCSRFDQILAEFEAGELVAAVNVLSGMFDAIVSDEAQAKS